MKLSAVLTEGVIDATGRFRDKRRSDLVAQSVVTRRERSSDQDRYTRVFRRAIEGALRGRWKSEFQAPSLKPVEQMSPLEVLMDNIPLTVQQDADPVKRRVVMFVKDRKDLIYEVLHKERKKLIKIERSLERHQNKIPYPSLIQQELDMYLRENELFLRAVTELLKRRT